jgi:hypothetical protein
MMRLPPSLAALFLLWLVASNAAIITVFPRPISSARMPPRHFDLEKGGLRLT